MVTKTRLGRGRMKACTPVRTQRISHSRKKPMVTSQGIARIRAFSLITLPSRHGCMRAARGRSRRNAAQKSRSEEHTSELQSLMRISYAVFCLKKKTYNKNKKSTTHKKQHLTTSH